MGKSAKTIVSTPERVNPVAKLAANGPVQGGLALNKAVFNSMLAGSGNRACSRLRKNRLKRDDFASFCRGNPLKKD